MATATKNRIGTVGSNGLKGLKRGNGRAGTKKASSAKTAAVDAKTQSKLVKQLRLRVSLVGMLPGFLMHSRQSMIEDNKSPRTTRRTPEEEAVLAAYYVDRKFANDPRKRQLAMPWRSFYNAAQAGGKNFKNGRSTFCRTIAATITCELDFIPLTLSGKPLRDYSVFEEFVKIPPRTGGTVLTGRALVPKWECVFDILVNAEHYGDQLLEILFGAFTDAGSLVGIGAWSPHQPSPGPYGKWRVDSLELAE